RDWSSDVCSSDLQFLRTERLGDVVVGAELEPRDPIDLLTTRREYDDRQVRQVRPAQDLAQHVEPGIPWEHDVEDHEDRTLFGDRIEGLRTAGRGPDLVAFPGEVVREQRSYVPLVLEVQDSRRLHRLRRSRAHTCLLPVPGSIAPHHPGARPQRPPTGVGTEGQDRVTGTKRFDYAVSALARTRP